MSIRTTRADDYPGIRALVRAAFGQDLEADLVEALRRSGEAAIELVAEEDDQLVGHVLVSPLRSPEKCVALAPVSVLPAAQGRGVGSALVRGAIARAREGGWAAMFVLGEPGYYTRFGFSVDACERFESPYPKAYMMVLDLLERGLTDLSKKIVYARPFE